MEQTNRQAFKKISGTIIDVHEKGITIQPDDEREAIISYEFRDKDYSHFRVGQRVVHTSYTRMRNATEKDKMSYERMGMKCPELVPDYDYVVEDEEKANARKTAEEQNQSTGEHSCDER